MLTHYQNRELQIMRIVRHPNIVQLIDAAWHRLPNGVYEIFILMEFCSGAPVTIISILP